jgi:hypothetical protein
VGLEEIQMKAIRVIVGQHAAELATCIVEKGAPLLTLVD